MGGRWLSGLKNVVNNIRFILISYVEEIIQISYVRWRVSFIDKPGFGGGFADDHLEDDAVGLELEDDVDHEDLVVAYVEVDDIDIKDDVVDLEDDIIEEDVVGDVEDDIDIDEVVVADVEDDIDIDERAEKFIADFYEHLRLERQLDLDRQRLVDFYENLRLQRELLDLERQRRH